MTYTHSCATLIRQVCLTADNPSLWYLHACAVPSHRPLPASGSSLQQCDRWMIDVSQPAVRYSCGINDVVTGLRVLWRGRRNK